MFQFNLKKKSYILNFQYQKQSFLSYIKYINEKVKTKQNK